MQQISPNYDDYDSASKYISTKDSSIHSDTASYPYLTSTFQGDNLYYNYNNDFYLNQGTIKSYAEYSTNVLGQQRADWAIVNTDVLASDVFSAIRSSSKNDDEAVIQQILRGDDIFPFLIKMM